MVPGHGRGRQSRIAFIQDTPCRAENPSGDAMGSAGWPCPGSIRPWIEWSRTEYSGGAVSRRRYLLLLGAYLHRTCLQQYTGCSQPGLASVVASDLPARVQIPRKDKAMQPNVAFLVSAWGVDRRRRD